MNPSLFLFCTHVGVAVLAWLARHYSTPAAPAGPATPPPLPGPSAQLPFHLPPLTVSTGHPLMDKVATKLLQQAEAELEQAAADALARIYPAAAQAAPAEAAPAAKAA